ncbi:MAG: MarR family transcriptional regulator [Frankiales bacterium]|nr:MarR family transcriptional regulator [Frankiales bacterium]
MLVTSNHLGGPLSAIETVSRELVQLVRGLRELHGAVASASRHQVDPSGAAVLSRLDELGPVRLSTLATVLCLDVSTVSRQVPVLERQGWVARARDPEDQRAQLLDLTPAGRAVLTDVRQSRGEVLRRLMPDWTEAELDAFAAQLHRFNDDVTTNRQAIVLAATGTDNG